MELPTLAILVTLAHCAAFAATLTRCEYDRHELVVTQTNILGEKLFERRVRA